MLTNPWLFYALGSAFFAACTALLGKIGVENINSNLATLIRAIVIVLMTAAIITFRQEWQLPGKISRFGITMLILSGVATGLSWLCYWHAMQLGPASQVAPLDKLSVALVVLFALFFLGEPFTWQALAGVALIVSGVVLIAVQ